MSEKLTIEQIFEIIQNQETRIDHNFSTMLNMTILVEFMFDKLKTHMPNLNLEEDFEAFQNERIEEFNEIVKEAQSQAEDIQTQTEKIVEQIKI